MPPCPENDVFLSRDTNPKAFQELWARLNSIARGILRNLPNSHAQEDLIQQAWSEVLSSFNPKNGCIVGLFNIILRRRLTDLWREPRVPQTADDPAVTDPSEEAEFSEMLADLQAKVVECFGKLDDEEKFLARQRYPLNWKPAPTTAPPDLKELTRKLGERRADKEVHVLHVEWRALHVPWEPPPTLSSTRAKIHRLTLRLEECTGFAVWGKPPTEKKRSRARGPLKRTK